MNDEFFDVDLTLMLTFLMMNEFFESSLDILVWAEWLLDAI